MIHLLLFHFFRSDCESFDFFFGLLMEMLLFVSFEKKLFKSGISQIIAGAFHLRSDLIFPHVGQSSLFFNMFVLLDIGQKLHTQFLKFIPPPFFMGFEMFLEKSKKMN
jgi:hypothetical protein